MVTSLVAGVVPPLWDRMLVQAMTDALSALKDEPALWSFGIANDEGEVYRRVIVHGAPQHGAFLECLVSHGFYPARSPNEGVIVRRSRTPRP